MKKNPDRYSGTYVKYTGEIIQILEGKGQTHIRLSVTRGIIKKISYLAAVALTHQIDIWLGTGDALRSLSVSLFCQ